MENCDACFMRAGFIMISAQTRVPISSSNIISFFNSSTSSMFGFKRSVTISNSFTSREDIRSAKFCLVSDSDSLEEF